MMPTHPWIKNALAGMQQYRKINEHGIIIDGWTNANVNAKQMKTMGKINV